MFIDTHAHLWFDDYKDDLDEMIKRAKENGVAKFIVPGTDLESSRKAIEIAKKYPGVIYPAVGVHPEEQLNHKSSDHSPIIPQGSELWEQVVAIGEIGTDASTDELKNCMEEQKELFKAQCELAIEYDLPVIIHTRESLEETLEVLDSLPTMPRGQFHCFSHDEEGLKQVLSRGFYVSFCGNISWSKRVAKLVSKVPDHKLLLETDSPLMVPRDKKGKAINWVKKNSESSDLSFASLQTAERSELSGTGSELGDRNEPANVVYLAKLIAELRGQSIEKIAEITTENATRLFHL